MPKLEAEGTAGHEMLVLDASVLINLLGSGHVEVVLIAWKGSVVMVDRTFREVLKDPSGRMPAAADRQSLVDQGLIRVESLKLLRSASAPCASSSIPSSSICAAAAPVRARRRESGQRLSSIDSARR